jgi:hypothetical protein
LKKEYST